MTWGTIVAGIPQQHIKIFDRETWELGSPWGIMGENWLKESIGV
jgi:hypothetical protein